MRVTQDGKEYELTGMVAIPAKGRFYLGMDGWIHQCPGGFSEMLALAFPVPVSVQHIINGIAFEETGEVRVPVEGEWFLSRSGGMSFVSCQMKGGYTRNFPILRPIRIV